MNPLDPKELLNRTELVLVRPDVTREDLESACRVVREKAFRALCVNSSRVAIAFAELEETEVKVISTIDFPLGAADSDVKRYEVEAAMDNGAQEFELVLNVGQIKDRETDILLRELRDIVDAAEERPVSVLLAAKFLSREEQEFVCELAREGNARFVNAGNVEMDVLKFLREKLGEKFLLKVAANVLEESTARDWIEAGATHFTSPFTPEI